MRLSHWGVLVHFYKLYHLHQPTQNISINFTKKIFPALKAAALAGTAAGTCEYKCMMFYEIVYKLFLLHDFYQYYFFSAYNMVACRLTDMRNGHGANISQVPLKR